MNNLKHCRWLLEFTKLVPARPSLFATRVQDPVEIQQVRIQEFTLGALLNGDDSEAPSGSRAETE